MRPPAAPGSPAWILATLDPGACPAGAPWVSSAEVIDGVAGSANRRQAATFPAAFIFESHTSAFLALGPAPLDPPERPTQGEAVSEAPMAAVARSLLAAIERSYIG